MVFAGCDGTLTVTICADALATFQEHQQLHWWRRERGGVLFARSVGHANCNVDVAEATGPSARDRSGRTWLKLDHARCLQEISDRFHSGLHFVGYWHTHAETRPRLSPQDVASIRPLVADPGLDLARVLMVVVGGNRNTVSLDVSVLDRRSGTLIRLERDT